MRERAKREKGKKTCDEEKKVREVKKRKKEENSVEIQKRLYFGTKLKFDERREKTKEFVWREDICGV